MKFKFIEHTSDIEFEAYGKTLEETFENAALAVSEIMTNTKKINPKLKKRINLSSEDLESLLYDFLEQLLIYFDSENLVFSKFKVREINKDREYSIKADFSGEKFNLEKHGGKNAVKAITYHNMKIGKRKGKYFAHVLVDI